MQFYEVFLKIEMRLEEAASVLGVSIDEITVESLKQTYKKFTQEWDANKVYDTQHQLNHHGLISKYIDVQTKDEAAKQMFNEVSEAYNKLNSVMESTDSQRGDDSQEIAAFMRMFMDMVGISDNESVPAGLTFSFFTPFCM